MKTYSMTDTGALREMNQDYFFASETAVGNLPNLFLVADGMGGHKAGDYASRYTIERIVAGVSRNPKTEPVMILREAIQKANSLLIQDAKNDPDKAGMGTTLVAATIEGNQMLVANIGDSRLYVVGDKIRQVTRDHSLVNEMVRMGEIRAEDARNHPDKNIITRAVGAVEHVEIDFFEVDLKERETILLCTDGLTNMVADEYICKVVQNQMTLEEKGRLLVAVANSNGGLDNITIMLVQPFANDMTR